MYSIEIKDISRSYGKTAAVRDISLEVETGEIFGLIGPDGAGKTTLFRIMTTLMMPDSGSGRICGLDMVKDYYLIRKKIGYMPGKFSLYQDLSVKENLEFFATLFGTTVEDSYQTIREIYSQIEPFRDRRAGKLSGGMKQKLALCCALVHKPSVLFLDEPTTGVDAPYMDEAALCDRLALIKEGRIIGTGTPSSLVAAYPHRMLSVKAGRMYPLLKRLREMPGVISCFSFGDSHHVAYDPAMTGRERIVAEAARSGFTDCSAEEISPGIEDCFMQLSRKWTTQD